VIGVVQAEAARDADLLARERCEQALHGHDAAGQLRAGVERAAADELARRDLAALGRREADW
jgi:hypothetical protein